MHTVTNYFIVNLSFADVLVTIICLPASLVVDITETWFFGNTLCKVVPYLQVRDAFWHLLSTHNKRNLDLFQMIWRAKDLRLQAKTHVSVILKNVFHNIHVGGKEKKQPFHIL